MNNKTIKKKPIRTIKDDTSELPRYRATSDCYIGDGLIEKDQEVTIDGEYPPAWYLEPLNAAAKALDPNWDGIMPVYIPDGNALNQLAQLTKLAELQQMIAPN